MKKPKFYFCDLWRMNYYFYLGWPQAEFEKYIEKKYDFKPELPGVGKCIMTKNNKGKGAVLHIWIADKTNYPYLAHECLHAANWTLERAGWKPELHNDEPQTYLMTNIMRQALNRKL